MTKKNKVLKAGLWYTISNFFVKGITFIVTPIFTRIMTIGDIGVFSNITSWFNILAILTTFEIYSSIAVARFDYEDELDSYISSTLFLGTLITTIFYLIVIINHTFFENLFSMDIKTINILFMYLLFYPSIQMFQKKNQIEYKYVSTIIVSIGSSVLSSIISIICAIFCANALSGRIYGFYIPLIILSIIIYIYLLYKGKSLSPKYWKYALGISFPFVWHLLAGNLLNSSDRIMILKLQDSVSAALYSIASSCSMMVSVLWASMNTAWSPWSYEKMNKKEYNNLRKLSKPYFLLFLIIAVIFMLFAPEILYIMGGEQYIKAVYVIPPIMVGYIFQFVYSLYVNIEFYNKKQTYIAIGTIVAALTNIILNIIFIPIFGYIAAAYTTLIGYMVLYFMHYILVRKMGYSSWYDNKFFAAFLIFSLIFMLLVNIIYKFIIIRYILLLLILLACTVVIVKNRNVIKNMIKSRSLWPLFKMFNK